MEISQSDSEKNALLMRTRDAVLASITAALLERLALDIREWAEQSSASKH